jgi:peptidoglycan/xylan/chitin deacetylase (PgdA/CDA1 family)
MNKRGFHLFFITLCLMMGASRASAQYTTGRARNTSQSKPTKQHTTTFRYRNTTQPRRIGNTTDTGMTAHMTGITDNIPSENNEKNIYLTIDLASGGYDAAIINWLAQNRISATFFIAVDWIFPPSQETHINDLRSTARPRQFREIRKKPLFHIESHGHQSLPASVDGKRAYGVYGTKNPQELYDEISYAQTIIQNMTSDVRPYETPPPQWYRSGGAMYDSLAVSYITDTLGLKIAGFAKTDGGGILPADAIYNDMITAKPGDILLFNGTNPARNSFDALVRTITELRNRGYKFKHLPR